MTPSLSPAELQERAFSFTVAAMSTSASKQNAYKMSAEEVAAVKAGIADFAKGKYLTEEQFQAEMARYFARRQSEIESLSSKR
jgi:predicted transcriptional regulator